MEGDAGASRLNPTDTDDSAEELDTEAAVDSITDSTPEEETAPARRSRVSRAWFAAIAVLLALLAGALVVGGVFALQAHRGNTAAATSEEQAVEAAKDCVAATNAPDPATMAKSVQKILDCSTGDFGAYAKLMAPMMVDAYQVANAKVELTTMRAAAEKVNDDGTIEVLVAFRFKVPTNPDQQNQEVGLRLRATMKQEDGRYKINKLDQVMS
jgi:Mce-associated membrane protein